VPCAIKPPATSLINASGILTNVNCSAYFNYSRNQRIRTSAPTERVSLRSNYFHRLDLLGSFSYSSADMNTPLDENFAGLITRTHTLAFNGTGTASAQRISDVVDLEATLHLTRHFRLIEKFYFWAYRIPESGNFNEVDSNCTVTATCTLLTPPTATTPATVSTLSLSSFNQTWTKNQTELAWDISKKAGARIGYRYGDRAFNHLNDYQPGDVDHFVGLEKTALLGLWARPTHTWRLNFDLEHTNYNAVFVRLSPRKEARYRFQTTYTPKPWAVLGASVNILQQSNADIETQYDTANNLMANSYYTDHTNFGMATVRFKPEKRVTANVGYSITSVEGHIPQFNILQPPGTTQYKYQQPVANLSVDIGHKLAFNMGWNYYQYNENSFVGPTAPRYFHANNLTESLRYSF
jgi:hypothetical protein